MSTTKKQSHQRECKSAAGFPATLHLFCNLYNIRDVAIQSEADLFNDVHRNGLILSKFGQRTAADAYKIAKLQFFHIPLYKLVPQGLIGNCHIIASSGVFYFKMKHLSSIPLTVIMLSEKIILRNQNKVLTKRMCICILKIRLHEILF